MITLAGNDTLLVRIRVYVYINHVRAQGKCESMEQLSTSVHKSLILYPVGLTGAFDSRQSRNGVCLCVCLPSQTQREEREKHLKYYLLRQKGGSFPQMHIQCTSCRSHVTLLTFSSVGAEAIKRLQLPTIPSSYCCSVQFFVFSSLFV